MATGETAAPPPLNIPPPPIEPLSDDDGSSPLSDVEDKDNDSADLHHPHQDSHTAHADPSSDDDLSDANDTEAETERLYDTPRHPSRQKDVVFNQNAEGHVYDRTPSKLRQQRRLAAADDDDEPLSDADISMASSPPAQVTTQPTKLPSPTLDILAEAAFSHEVENRKRKRPSAPADPESAGQPPLKRGDSTGKKDVDGDTAMADENHSSNSHSGDPSADEAPVTNTDDQDASDEPKMDNEVPSKKQTRSGSKKQKASPNAVQIDEPPENVKDDTAPDDDGAAHADDEPPPEEVDEEAEAAHKNEEELERKRAAHESITAIEKRFFIFRERLYKERLEQLDQEEAMLRADVPTHPEYLAMMECIDSRRADKVRIADSELKFNVGTLERWAVAQRAQVHTQYFQTVRESRERVLAELGQQWYEIQAERRRQAHNVPEYGIRFPRTQHQRLKDALAYNKEVSILSGVAKYEGMPAAPDMRGASMAEMDDDFELINRGRPAAPPPQPTRPNYDFAGVPYMQGLTQAGEQFVEQTAWANPHHPSNAHLLQRQPSSQQEAPKPPSTARRVAHQANNQASNSGSGSTSVNGNGAAKTQRNAPARQISTSPEVTRAASLLEQSSARGLKAAAASVNTAIKREKATPVGGRA